jgi:hypothetical protein
MVTYQYSDLQAQAFHTIAQKLNQIFEEKNLRFKAICSYDHCVNPLKVRPFEVVTRKRVLRKSVDEIVYGQLLLTAGEYFDPHHPTILVEVSNEISDMVIPVVEEVEAWMYQESTQRKYDRTFSGIDIKVYRTN